MCEKVSCPQAAVHPRPPQYKSALVIAASYHTHWSHVAATKQAGLHLVASETPVATAALNLSALTGAVSRSLRRLLLCLLDLWVLPPAEVKHMWLHWIRPGQRHTSAARNAFYNYQEVSSCQKCKWKLCSLSGEAAVVGGAQAALDLEAEQWQKIHQVQYLDLDLHPERFKMMESVLIHAFGRCFLFFYLLLCFCHFKLFIPTINKKTL